MYVVKIHLLNKVVNIRIILLMQMISPVEVWFLLSVKILCDSGTILKEIPRSTVLP